MSFDNPVTLPNVGAVDDHDIVQFTATSLGDITAGTFSMYFDGEDVGMTSTAADIDALNLLPDGRVLISTSGTVTLAGLKYLDEDVAAFTPTSLGSNTAGSFSVYFDGSDVDLATDSGEDVDGLSEDANGEIFLSTRGNFAVTGVSGTAVDIFECVPTSLGSTTACNYSPNLIFTGSLYGLSANNIDGMEVDVQ
jgi:hypothetical protein